MRNSGQVLLILSAVAIAAALVGQCGRSVEQWSPEHYASAGATATSVPYILEATRTYNERVIPTVQAMEAQERAATVAVKEEARRAFSWAVALGGIASITSISLAALAWGGGTLANRVIVTVVQSKAARELPSVGLLPGGGRQPVLTAQGIADPRTGYRFALEPGEGSVEHARALTEYNVALPREIALALGRPVRFPLPAEDRNDSNKRG